MNNLKLPHYLLIGYLILFAVLAIDPYDRALWWAENIPIMMIVAILVLTYPKFQFSNTAYLLMSVLIIMHTIGGHYSFARVPFDWFTDFFGFERNHYDRIAHFSVGFYAYAAAELLLIKKMVNSRLILFLFPVFFILSIAGIYEIFEWQFAVMSDSEAGHELLGSQGDQWDAQKDILADGLGALVATWLFFWVQRKNINKLGKSWIRSLV